MSCKKKGKDSDGKVPNYSQYEYAETIQTFSESDGLLESELHSLECYGEFKLEAPLNSFSDTNLNDHLCMMYKRKQLETSTLMRKLVGFFVWQFEKKLTVRVRK